MLIKGNPNEFWFITNSFGLHVVRGVNTGFFPLSKDMKVDLYLNCTLRNVSVSGFSSSHVAGLNASRGRG